MNKAEIFKAAHKLARTFEGDYRACFALAIKEIYSLIAKGLSLFKAEFQHRLMAKGFKLFPKYIFAKSEIQAETKANNIDMLNCSLAKLSKVA